MPGASIKKIAAGHSCSAEDELEPDKSCTANSIVLGSTHFDWRWCGWGQGLAVCWAIAQPKWLMRKTLPSLFYQYMSILRIVAFYTWITVIPFILN